MDKFLQEVYAADLHVVDDEEPLKRKVKSLNDCYRNELHKIKRSKKGGADADDIYTPKRVWFSKADAFMRNVMAGKESSSNLVSDASAWQQTFKKAITELSSTCMQRLSNSGYATI